MGGAAGQQTYGAPKDYYIPSRLASTEAYSDAISSSDKAAAIAAENKKAQVEVKIPVSENKNILLPKKQLRKIKAFE
jgi:hypothetical protein